jgi:hypothetical protein
MKLPEPSVARKYYWKKEAVKAHSGTRILVLFQSELQERRDQLVLVLVAAVPGELSFLPSQ